MFSNSVHVPVMAEISQSERIESQAKVQEVLQDANLMKQLRQYVLFLSDLSEFTVEPSYTLADECEEFAQ